MTWTNVVDTKYRYGSKQHQCFALVHVGHVRNSRRQFREQLGGDIVAESGVSISAIISASLLWGAPAPWPPSPWGRPIDLPRAATRRPFSSSLYHLTFLQTAQLTGVTWIDFLFRSHRCPVRWSVLRTSLPLHSSSIWCCALKLTYLRHTAPSTLRNFTRPAVIM